MKILYLGFITVTLLISQSSLVMAESPAIKSLMTDYQSKGAKVGNAHNGEKIWNKVFTGKAPFTERSCKSCHTNNLKNSGKHARTGKILKSMAPSVNTSSLSKAKKIKKWFKRNCKWTIGRECSVQEKADILAFIKQQ